MAHQKDMFASKGNPRGRLADEVAALAEIANMKDLCLLGPSHDQHGERLHELGANKAFNQCADIAGAALSEPTP